jgi:methyl-CpG-binding domain protein 4
MAPGTLVQQELPDSNLYPWYMLNACVLLSRVHPKPVREVMPALIAKYPDPGAMAFADEAELTAMLEPLGLHEKRAKTLIRLARDWLAGVPRKKMYGVGPYAEESWRIFVVGDIDFNPKDLRLAEYVSWARQERKAGREYRVPYVTKRAIPHGGQAA